MEQLEDSSRKLSKLSLYAILGTILSRCSGVIRTIIVNGIFGANIRMDAFNLAFRVPNSLRDLLADGALSSAVMTVYMNDSKKSPLERQKSLSIITGFFFTLTFTLAVLGIIFSDNLMHLLASSSTSQETLLLGSGLFKILSFFLPLTSLNAISMAILGCQGKTFKAMNASIFFSLGMILGALVIKPLLPPEQDVFALALGALLGVAIQYLYQTSPLVLDGTLGLPLFSFSAWLKSSELKEVIKLILPRVVGQGALILALLINTYFALRCGEGILTYITTTILIIQVPIGVFGVATGFATQPVLSEAYLDGQRKRFERLVHESMNTTFLLGVFSTLFLCFFSLPFYGIFFEYGKITSHDTLQSAGIICAYAIGITFIGGSKILTSACYSLGSARQVTWNALIYLLINAILSSFLYRIFGGIGLGISFSIASCIDFFLNLTFLSYLTKRKFKDVPSSHRSFKKIIFFSPLLFLIGFLGLIFSPKIWTPLLGHHYLYATFTAFGVLLSGSLFLLVIWLYGPSHLKSMFLSVTKKLWQ